MKARVLLLTERLVCRGTEMGVFSKYHANKTSLLSELASHVITSGAEVFLSTYTTGCMEPWFITGRPASGQRDIQHRLLYMKPFSIPSIDTERPVKHQQATPPLQECTTHTVISVISQSRAINLTCMAQWTNTAIALKHQHKTPKSNKSAITFRQFTNKHSPAAATASKPHSSKQPGPLIIHVFDLQTINN